MPLGPVVGLIINALFQIIAFRFFKLGLLKSVFLGFFMGLFSVIGIIRDFSGILITDLLSYSALGYCYFHFINLGETARRIRILTELYDSKSGLLAEELFARYNAKEILQKRLARLTDNGQIILKADRYYIGNPIVLLIAKAIVGMKLLILGRKNEDIRD